MWKQQGKTSRNMKSQENMTSTKEHNKLLIFKPKDSENCGLPDKKFKVAVLRLINEIWENTERQFKKNKENQTWTKWEI